MTSILQAVRCNIANFFMGNGYSHLLQFFSSITPRVVALAVLFCSQISLAAETYSFGVLPQRTPLMIAQYWNPILDWVARRSGVALDIKIAKSGGAAGDAVRNGEYDFAYSNHQFKPSTMPQGYKVILRREVPEIQGALVVLDSSPIKAVKDLSEKTVVFANPHGFTGYTVQMDYLVSEGIGVTPTFGGNQDGALAQLRLGSADAAGVNVAILSSYEKREGIRVRKIWTSKPYPDLAISAHPRVPQKIVEAVRRAFVAMVTDPEGKKILEASAQLVGEAKAAPFISATQKDYEDYLDFYLHNQFHGAD